MVPSGMKLSVQVTKASASHSPTWGVFGLLGEEGWPTEPPPAGLRPLYSLARGSCTPDSYWAAVVLEGLEPHWTRGLGLWQNGVPARFR